MIVWLTATRGVRESKAPSAETFAVLSALRDGRLVGFRVYDTLAAAAAAAGI